MGVEGSSSNLAPQHVEPLLEREPVDAASDNWGLIVPVAHHGVATDDIEEGGVGGRDSTFVSPSD